MVLASVAWLEAMATKSTDKKIAELAVKRLRCLTATFLFKLNILRMIARMEPKVKP